MNNHRVTHRSPILVIASAGIVLMAIASGIAYLTADSAEQAASHTASTTGSDSAAARDHILDERSVARFDKIVQDAVAVDQGDHRAVSGARLSHEVNEDGERRAISTLDTDDSPWDAGNYQLTVYCMGTGTLDVSFAIGGHHAERTMPCADDIRQESLSVQTEGASEGQISITPSEDSESAIAYWIDQTGASPNE